MVRRQLGIALGVAALMVVTGCTATSSGDDEQGGGERTYVQAIGDEPTSFNAQFVSGQGPSGFSAQLFDPLIRISDQYEISPGLAESWELSADELYLTLELRDDVTWHDGEPFTADDVKFNFDEIIELQTFGSGLAERIESVDVIDDHTVTVHLTQAFGPLLETIALQFMLPKHIYEGTDYITNEANMAPIGTGPMMFEEYNPGEHVVFVKNPDYWEGDVQVDRAIYPIMGDANTRALSLFAGEVDQAAIDPSQMSRVADNPDLAVMEGGRFPQVIASMWNVNSAELQDPQVRSLLFSVMDREAITETALSGLGEPAQGFFPPSIGWAVNEDIDFDEDFASDIDAVNAGLDEAGFPVQEDGWRFTLDVRYINALTETAASAELAKSQLAEVGVNLNLVGSAGPIFTEKVYTEGDFDLAFLRSTLGADPSLGIARWYTCNPDKAAASNPSGICDPELAAAAEGALTSVDRETRGEYLRQMQERARELVFYTPLSWYSGDAPVVNTSRWEGQLEPMPATNRTPWTTMTYVG